MEIAIYEIIHLDWVIPLCELLEDTEHNVSFFTSAEFETDIRTTLPHSFQKFNWSFVKSQISRSSFLAQAQDFFRSKPFDLVLLNSADALHLFLYQMLRTNPAFLLINVHDVNNFFRSHYSFNPRKFIRSAGKRLLNRRADAFLVNFQEMKQYIATQRLTNKPVYTLPPVFSKARLLHNEMAPLSVVVPGSIDVRRRDYALVLTAWEKLNRRDAVLTLAGRPVGAYGQTMLLKARELIDKGYTIRYFLEEVPEQEFQEIIAGATLLLSPLVLHTSIHDNIWETYGQSKFSGNIYDAIRHGKPLIVPKDLQVPEAIRSSCRFFAGADGLAQVLQELMTSEKERKDLCNLAYRNSQLYSKEAIIGQFTLILDDITRRKTPKH